MQNEKLEFNVVMSVCGHPDTILLYGREDLESRKRYLINSSPCKTCIELNRIASGIACGKYKPDPRQLKVTWWDKFYPKWRDSVPIVKTLEPCFKARKDWRNETLEWWLNGKD